MACEARHHGLVHRKCGVLLCSVTCHGVMMSRIPSVLTCMPRGEGKKTCQLNCGECGAAPPHVCSSTTATATAGALLLQRPPRGWQAGTPPHAAPTATDDRMRGADLCTCIYACVLVISALVYSNIPGHGGGCTHTTAQKGTLLVASCQSASPSGHGPVIGQDQGHRAVGTAEAAGESSGRVRATEGERQRGTASTYPEPRDKKDRWR